MPRSVRESKAIKAAKKAWEIQGEAQHATQELLGNAIEDQIERSDDEPDEIPDDPIEALQQIAQENKK